MKQLFALMVVGGILGAMGGCGSRGESAYVNEGIAGAYQEFYDKGTSDAAGALAALERAEKGDPANAYTQYLKASFYAQKGDLGAALEAMEKGHGMEKAVHYVATPPPGDPMQTLMRIRQLGFSTEKAGDLGERAPEYFEAVKEVGVRVANSEPLTTLGVINGVGVIRRTLQSEIAYWEEKEDADRASGSKTKAEELAAWQEEFTAKLADSLVNLMTEAGKEAGLTEDELADYAAGKDLKDKGKQKKADAARVKFYEREISVLREMLGTMPKV